MKDVKLYINNKEVDITNNIDFPFTYQIEDLSNPTVVKNMFSKSIEIDGTDNNNLIFGEIYNLDRVQQYDFIDTTGVNFNPTKRTKFELYCNNELIENGYIQLNNISIQNNKVKYNVTLYGGLGDFLYNLMFNQENDTLTLADLDYNLDDEFQFNINKDFVNDCWNNTCVNGNSLKNLITFVPSYNGLHNDFANGKFLVNIKNNLAFPITQTTDNGVTYSAYEGYSLLESDKDYTEWETKDLRSYHQRPAIRLKKIIDAISNPNNNGGYKVELDESFFNPSNPYYEKSFLALPLLSNNADENITSGLTGELMVTNQWIGKKGNDKKTQSSTPINLTGQVITTIEGAIDTTTIPLGSLMNLKVAFDLNATIDNQPAIGESDELYLTNFLVNLEGNKISTTKTYTSILVQAYMQDMNTLENIWSSEILNFTNSAEIGNDVSAPDKWINYTPIPGEMKTMNGRFVKTGDKQYKFKLFDGNASTFAVFIENVPRRENVKMSIMIKLVSSTHLNNTRAVPLYSKSYILAKKGIDTNTNKEVNVNVYTAATYFTQAINSNIANSNFTAVLKQPTLTSNQLITKNWLLKTEYSPADVLLSFTKLFGLMLEKDVHSKTVKILTKNSFYTNNIVDIEDKIDWSKESKVTPTLMQQKYLLMKSESNDTYFAKKYKNNYNTEFGQKRINTNYNFNNEENNIYDGNIFQNVVTILDDSPYYRTFYNKNNKNVPSVVVDNPVLKLFNGVGTDDEKNTEITIYNQNTINYNKLVPFNEKDGYDIFPKICCYEKDNGEKSLQDITSCLLIYNGDVETKDVNGDDVAYWLTDDVYQMFILNDESCWLYTEQEKDSFSNKIAIKRTTLPQFTRYNIISNNVTDSLDFGLPKELYFFNKTYNEDATLYNKFWKNYLIDRYDVNTRVLTTYVKFDKFLNYETMKDFYYFKNSYWVINKIENYSPFSTEPVKVEFIKVNDITNYQSQAEYFYPTIQLSKYVLTVDYDETKTEIELTSNNDWQARVIGFDGSLKPSSGEAGTTTIDVSYPENNTLEEKEYFYKFYIPNYGEKYLSVYQLPNPNTTIMLSGYVYNKKNATPFVNAKVQVGEIVAYTNADGYYKMYLQKNKSADVEVYVDDELQVMQFVSATQNNLELNFPIKL